MFLPLVLVSVTADLSLGTVYDLALHDSAQYARHVENAAEAMYTFGGVFLLMVIFNFALDPERDVH